MITRRSEVYRKLNDVVDDDLYDNFERELPVLYSLAVKSGTDLIGELNAELNNLLNEINDLRFRTHIKI